MERDKRTDFLTIRTRPRERRMLDRAAEASGRSVSELVRDAAKLEAMEALGRLNNTSNRED